MDVLTNHPYRFAFRNTHLWAMHTNDEHHTKFAANSFGGYSHGFTDTFKTDQEAYYQAGLTPEQQLVAIEAWLNRSWYRHTSESPNFYASLSPTGAINAAVISMLNQADELKADGNQIVFTHEQGHIHLDLESYISNLQLEYKRPLVQWELVSPTLPIVRVTTYFEHQLPYLPPRETFELEDDYLPPEILEQQTTRFAISFVVSFQQRWETFQPERPHRSLHPTAFQTASRQQIHR